MNPILIIISLNVGIAIATAISPGLVYDLGLYSPAELFIDYPWGILTSMFVHDGLFHLFANMITLYFFGSFLNRLIGSSRLLLIYLGGGLIGGVLFVLLGTLLNPDTPALAVGASGAVFALGGALAVMAPKLRVIIFPIPVPMPLWVAVVGIFVILTLLPMLSAFSNIAWQAHLGGFLFGLVTGYIFKGKRRNYA
ncbi:MAG: rhomboid family intramembrane serine protease [Chloroflexota bacterium]